jgi:hypothetical protein
MNLAASSLLVYAKIHNIGCHEKTPVSPPKFGKNRWKYVVMKTLTPGAKSQYIVTSREYFIRLHMFVPTYIVIYSETWDPGLRS